MTQDGIDFKKALSGLLEEDARNNKPLSKGELDKWRSQNLDEETRRDLDKRLLLDREGVRALVDQALEEPPNSDASWSQFEARLENWDDAEDGPFPGNKPPGSPLLHKMGGLLAAALVLFALLLSYQVMTLRSERKLLTAPGLSDRVHLVTLGDPATRSDLQPITLSDGRLVLQLRISNHLGNYPTWGVSISDPDGRLVYKGEAALDDFRMLTLSLAHDYFKVPGQYKVDVFGVNQGVEINSGGIIIQIEL